MIKEGSCQIGLTLFDLNSKPTNAFPVKGNSRGIGCDALLCTSEMVPRVSCSPALTRGCGGVAYACDNCVRDMCVCVVNVCAIHKVMSIA